MLAFLKGRAAKGQRDANASNGGEEDRGQGTHDGTVAATSISEPTTSGDPATAAELAAQQPSPIHVSVEYTLTEAFPTWQPDANVHARPEKDCGTPLPVNSNHADDRLSEEASTEATSTTTQQTPATPRTPETRYSAPSPTQTPSSPAPYTPPRSRRTRSSLANRSQPELHAARVQRSSTLTSVSVEKRDSLREPKTKKFQRHSSTSQASADSPATPDREGLTKMEHQKWITVQQKTFTKW